MSEAEIGAARFGVHQSPAISAHLGGDAH